MLRNDRLRVGEKNRNCIDLNEKAFKTDYQRKRCIVTVENQLQTIQLLAALALRTRLSRPGVLIPVIFHINLLTNEAMFTGWNPTGTEVT